MTFEAKQEVAIRNQTTPFRRGVFLAYVTTQFAAVKFPNGRLEQIDVDLLMPEADAVAEEAVIDAANSQLEQEYSVIRNEISAKMQIAADALSEASRLASKMRGVEDWDHDEAVTLPSLYDECRPFLRAMDKAGWSTSSLSC